LSKDKCNKRVDRRSGSILVMALLLVVLVATIGLATIAGMSGRYAASRGNLASFKASSLAKMGIEDMLIKLAKDPFFPEGVPDDHKEFSYQDVVNGPDGKETGLYTCTIDWTHREDGYFVLTSVGTLGSIKEPRSRYRMRCNLTLDEFRVENWREGRIGGS
jgi:hypothetical protein